MGKRSGIGGAKKIVETDEMAAMADMLLPLDGGNDWLLDDRQLETSDQLAESIIHKRRPHRKNFAALKQEKLQDVIASIPAPGETFHIISNGKYDFWSFVPTVIGYLGNRVDLFYGSTWTMNRNNVVEMFELFDQGKIGKLAVLTGTYFKRRESAVYARLAEGMIQRGQKFLAFENHSKIVLLATADHFITIEGSANFTANPRVEQYTMSNDRELLEFHQAWMEEMLK